MTNSEIDATDIVDLKIAKNRVFQQNSWEAAVGEGLLHTESGRSDVTF